MSTFTAINGQTVTDETMETLEQAYAQGTFPPTEKNLGHVINGFPRAPGKSPANRLDTKPRLLCGMAKPKPSGQG